MMIHDMRFHTQAINTHGKIRHFDSIECAMLYKEERKEELRSVYAADFLHPGKYLLLEGGEGDQAVVIHSEKIRSPMAGGLAAVSRENSKQMLDRYGGEAMDVAALARFIRSMGPAAR